MVEHLGWASVFFLNVPIGIIAFVVATFTVRESRSEQERKLDIVGLVLGTSALFLVTYGLIEANALGWGNPGSSRRWPGSRSCWRRSCRGSCAPSTR